MEELHRYYQNRIHQTKEILGRVSSRLRQLSIARILAFITVAGGSYGWITESTWWAIPTVSGAVVFLWLVGKFSQRKEEKKRTLKMLELLNQEVRGLAGDFSSFDGGHRCKDSSHSFSSDLDLFGDYSFFQTMNRTTSSEGNAYLAALLTNNDIADVAEKQEAVKDIASIPEWQQEFRSYAALQTSEISSETLLAAFNNHPTKTSTISFWIRGFQIISLLLVAASIASLISSMWVFYWFIFGLLLSGPYFKQANRLSQLGSMAQDMLRRYYPLLERVENRKVTAAPLRKIKDMVQPSEGKPASVLLSELSDLFDNLDQRNNLIMGAIGNGLFLSDRVRGAKIDRWIIAHREKLTSWMQAVHQTEAWISLGNYAFNHPKYVYPKLQNEDATTMEIHALGHPMIPEEKSIPNNLLIKEHHFHVITGANMAGKSTYLRSVGLALVMANSGLPVCASQMTYRPTKLYSSMRTSDDLHREASYFYAELERLQEIVQALRTEPYFVILDEILKGTNSKDKAEGSALFVQKLGRSGATGLIATHDLSLCRLEDEHDNIQNYYFEAYTTEDQLWFDYLIKPGVCQTMNASFLMKKMGIV